MKQPPLGSRSKSLLPLLVLTTVIGTCRTLAAADDSQAEQTPVKADVVLQGGTLMDGEGRRTAGDLAIRDDRIVAVGNFEVAPGAYVVDCDGLIVCPGFIDLHNHSDRPILQPETRANLNYITQGCTTIVTGNCGAGPTDVAKYYGQIEQLGAGTNVAHLIPHGSLRGDVLGRANRTAEPDEITRMRELVDGGMSEGAWGMSTGLIYVPGTYSDTAELTALNDIVAKHGGLYASHIRNEGTELLSAIDELIEIARETGVRAHVSHFKSSGRDAWGLIRQAAAMIEAARAEGLVVTADQYPYIASSTSLGATLLPSWARAGDTEARRARLDAPETAARIRESVAESLQRKDGGSGIRIARYSPQPAWIGRSIRDIAEQTGEDILDLVFEIERNGGATIVNFSMNEDDVRYAMQLPWVATASDGRAEIVGKDKPHPRYYGTFPRKLGHYSLQEDVLPLEQAIHSSTGLAAEILGLDDRGDLKVGHFADVVAFDPQQLIDNATFDEPQRYASGIRHVYVNGIPAIADGHPTGALAGRALRKTD